MTRAFVTITDGDKHISMDVGYDCDFNRMLKVLSEYYSDTSSALKLIKSGEASAIRNNGEPVREGGKEYAPFFEWSHWQDLVGNAVHADCSYIFYFDGSKWGGMGVDYPKFS